MKIEFRIASWINYIQKFVGKKENLQKKITVPKGNYSPTCSHRPIPKICELGYFWLL